MITKTPSRTYLVRLAAVLPGLVGLAIPSPRLRKEHQVKAADVEFAWVVLDGVPTYVMFDLTTEMIIAAQPTTWTGCVHAVSANVSGFFVNPVGNPGSRIHRQSRRCCTGCGVTLESAENWYRDYAAARGATHNAAA